MKLRSWGHKQRDEELDDEIQSHLEMAMRERIERGETPEQAKYSALREFGNRGLVKEVTRDTWGWRWLERLGQDLRYSLRALRKSPGFTVVAVLMLGLSIGATTATFSLVDAFLLRLLPVKHPEQLVFVDRVTPKGGTADDFPYATFEQLRDRSHSFSGMFAWDDSNITVAINGHSDMVPADFASDNYFDVLGISALLGRTFTTGDDYPGNNQVTVISYGYWQRQFSGDPTVVGGTIYLGGLPFTIIGVTPRGFFGRNVAGRTADVVVPMSMHPQLGLKDHTNFFIMGRLARGAAVQQAVAELNVAYRQILRAAAGSEISAEVAQQIDAQKIELKSASRGTSGLNQEFGTELRILMAVVAIALLIATVNMANMLLARAASRRIEVAIRASIGASRRRLIAQFLTESALLALCGGAFGLLLAASGVQFLLTTLSYGGADVTFGFSPDLRVLGFTSAVSLMTGILFGLVPALKTSRVDLLAVLKSGEGATESTPLYRRLAQCLVVSQVALSLVLLIGAGLLIRSLWRLYQVDTGFNRDKVLVGWIVPVMAGYDQAREIGLYRQLSEKLNSIPGVRAASVARYRLMFARPDRQMLVPGATQGDREVYCYPVGPRFFEALDIRLRVGRVFSPADTETSSKVAVVSEAVAQKFFPHQNPLGRRFSLDKLEPTNQFQIVGVVKNIQPQLRKQQPLQAVYIPYAQAFADDYGQMTLVLRTALDPQSIIPTVRRQVESVDKNLPVLDLKTQAADTDEALGDERSLATLLTLFAGLALTLAAIGLYGTVSYGVARRTKEVGIRLALGAERSGILSMVVRESLAPVLLGIAIGIPASAAATRMIASLVFGVTPADPMTISIASGVLLAVALAAAYLPAHRASRVEPMLSLRWE